MLWRFEHGRTAVRPWLKVVIYLKGENPSVTVDEVFVVVVYGEANACDEACFIGAVVKETAFIGEPFGGVVVYDESVEWQGFCFCRQRFAS